MKSIEIDSTPEEEQRLSGYKTHSPEDFLNKEAIIRASKLMTEAWARQDAAEAAAAEGNPEGQPEG